MDICANQVNPELQARKFAPLFVPLGLFLIGLVLLPFDCVYNQVLAVALISIGGYSLMKRMQRNYCMKKRSSGQSA